MLKVSWKCWVEYNGANRVLINIDRKGYSRI